MVKSEVLCKVAVQMIYRDPCPQSAKTDLPPARELPPPSLISSCWSLPCLLKSSISGLIVLDLAFGSTVLHVIILVRKLLTFASLLVTTGVVGLSCFIFFSLLYFLFVNGIHVILISTIRILVLLVVILIDRIHCLIRDSGPAVTAMLVLSPNSDDRAGKLVVVSMAGLWSGR